MKKLVKVLALVLALTLAMAPATEAQAATTILKMNAANDTFFAAKSSKKIATKTGNYNVKISKKVKNGQAGSFIDFKAPKAGVYQIKMSNLHCAKNKEGNYVDVSMWVTASNYESPTYDVTCYFAGLKNYNSITLCDKNYYAEYQRIYGKKDHVKSATINCKLKKSDHLIISLDGFGSWYSANEVIDTFAFDMKITKK